MHKGTYTPGRFARLRLKSFVKTVSEFSARVPDEVSEGGPDSNSFKMQMLSVYCQTCS